MLQALPVEKLRMVCDPHTLGCQTSEEVAPLESIVGQERAVRALQFGLGIQGLGFNTYVAGVPGTGKETLVKCFLDEVAKDKAVPSDWCYVNNFEDPYRSRALRFPPGRAKAFQGGMCELVALARREIRRVFDSDEYAAKREETFKTFQRQKERLLGELGERVKAEGFVIQSTPLGMVTLPLKDGKPITDEQFLALSLEERQQILERKDSLQGELKTALRQIKNLDKQADRQIAALDREVALFALNHLVEDIEEQYQDLAEVVAYLQAVKKDILDNLADFKGESKAELALPVPGLGDKGQAATKYEVNVLVDNSQLAGTPVVMELNPTYNNLFGRIEKEAQFGTMVTDFTMIRAGCLHRANGGYLVLAVEDVLRNLFSWDSLKRALRNREISIEEAGERLGFITTKSLRPEPIPLEIKVILIGQLLFYYLLHTYDKDFSELFKVKADFDTQMERTVENERNYVAFTCSLCNEEGLSHLDQSALAKLVEYGSRLAEDQEKLSTKFGDLADVIREANFYAAQDNSGYVTSSHLKQAIEERFYRSNLLQERIQEMIERDTLKIDVSGEFIGQVNGLSVISLGDISFGRPSRITASLGLGREGLIDIEKQAELGGPIHSKGVMILSGYLTEKYTQNKPLSLSARLVFEQSYSGVEGDSASSAELYALLSSLSSVPIKQGIAVTGSVNQKGQVQAIGGVNEKIEGFFAVCQVKGLTGQQGVLIPESNVNNLMLKEEVVEAVQAGQFHIWPVETVDEGIEILTGVKAGQRREDGTFEAGTVSSSVDKRLRELAQVARDFAGLSGEGKAMSENGI
jgi:lon-related putative ATP-dependent protease